MRLKCRFPGRALLSSLFRYIRSSSPAKVVQTCMVVRCPQYQLGHLTAH